MLARLLRSGLILTLVFALVWAATILWWQSIHRMPTTADIVTHLFLLPAGMIAGYLVLRRALEGIRSNVAAGARTAGAGGAAAQAPGMDGEAPAAAVDPSLKWRAAVLGAAMHTALGSDPVATAAAALEQKRPDLVDLLNDGAPLFAAVAPGLDVDGTREALERTQAGAPWSDEAVRTVALAASAAERMLIGTLQRYPLLSPDHPQRGTAIPAASEPLRLVLTLLVPAHWMAEAAAAAAQVLRVRLTELWPAEHLSLEPLLARSAADALVHVDRAIVALHRDASPALRGIIAADSTIGTQAIQRLRAANRLFGAGNEHGVTPGEGAAALLLGLPQALPGRALAATAPPAWMSRATLSQLDAPTPSKGQPNPSALDQALRATLALLSSEHAGAQAGAQAGERAGQQAADPKAPGETDATGDGTEPATTPVAATADLCPHPVRTVELARVISERLEPLDLSSDVLPLGAPCGDTGSAGALLAVVLAHQQCTERGGPVLAMTVADPRQRGAIALLPPPQPSVS